MDTRILLGAIAALFALMGLGALQMMVGDWTWRTPLGLFAPLDFVGVFVAMVLGGYVARQRRFRWVALVLHLVAWALTLTALMAMPAAGTTPSMRSPGSLLAFHALPMLIGLALAYAGAVVGERLALRGPVPATATRPPVPPAS